MSQMDLKGDIERIASNLFSLEINTIINANMTGEKFPTIPEALAGVAYEYEKKLPLLGAPPPDGAPVSGAPLPARFSALAERAGNALARVPATAAGAALEDYYMLARIKENARLLAPIAARGDGVSSAEIALVRKIWELGTEEIAFQTVIQLDGDVITRLQPKYAEASQRALHAIHGQAVSVSVGFWKSLVDLLEAAFGVAWRTLAEK